MEYTKKNEIKKINLQVFNEIWKIDDNLTTSEFLYFIERKILSCIDKRTYEIVDEKTLNELRLFLKKTLDKDQSNSIVRKLYQEKDNPLFIRGFILLMKNIIRIQNLPKYHTIKIEKMTTEDLIRFRENEVC